MTIGLLKWFDRIKGFGIIGTPEKGDVFLHESNLNINSNLLKKGTPLCFIEKIERKKNAAKECRIAENLDDLKLALAYIGKKDTITIEVTIEGKSRWGNPYKRKENRSVSLIKATFNRIKKNVEENDLIELLKDYYESNLDYSYFNNYCEFINEIYPQKRSWGFLFDDTHEKEEKYQKNNAELLFEYFGENLNEQVLFEVWKNKKFEFIGREKDGDYEIPKDVLIKNKSSFTISDLERVIQYDYGKDFVYDTIKQSLINSEELQWTSREILRVINKLDKEKTEELTLELYEKIEKKTQNIIISRASDIGLIDSENSFQSYSRLKYNIPNELDENIKSSIKELVDNLIVENVDDSFKINLWLKGFEINVLEDEIKSKFKQSDTTISQKKTILAKVDDRLKKQLIGEYFVAERPIKGFELMEGLLKEMNSLNYGFSLRKTLFDEHFWVDKQGKSILQTVKELVDKISTPDEIYTLFFLGLSNKFPEQKIKDNVLNLSQSEFKTICKDNRCTDDFLMGLIKDYIKKDDITQDIDWLYSIAKDSLSSNDFDEFDNICFLEFNEADYFDLWEKGSGKIIPKQQIIRLLDENYKSYNVIPEWQDKNVISNEQLLNILINNLTAIGAIEDRKTFYKAYCHIKAVKDYLNNGVEEVKNIGNQFFTLILWFFGEENSLQFELLKSKFIYFNPDDQVRIIKKIFQQIQNESIQLTIEDLNEIMRIDIDLYKANLKFNPTIPLDISTDIVIKAILNYKRKGKFLVESELLEIVLHDLFDDKKRKFKIGNYFEKCEGRLTAEFDWSRNGEISKVSFGENKFYFRIEFEYDPSLVEKVKKIPGRKYNSEGRHWGVPSKYKDEILQFAKENRFFLNFEGSNYSNNAHLAEFKRAEVPRGISFCDGRVSNKSHQMFNRKFWWCANQPCFQNCETIHNPNQWEDYTILDFLLILGFTVDETKSNPKDFVPKGEYYKFISLLNRFNRLLEKIYCHECDEILYPVQSSHFAAYTVVRFCCENNKCGEHKKVVYLNHCLNGKCNSIIDSRVSKKCPNGLYICETCGSCCSHSFFQRRKENLETADNFDNEQKIWIYNDTKRKYDKKLGHLERANYYCHKDGQKMTEVETDVFECNCGNKYDTTSYRIKRPHRNLKHENINDDDFPNEMEF